MSKLKYTSWSSILGYAILLLIPFFLYGYALNYGFTIGEEFHFYQNFSLQEVISFFTSNTWPRYDYYYRPLTQVTYFLDYKIWGLHTCGFHVTSLFLYGLCLVALFHLIYLLSRSRLLSWIFSLFFLIYPSHAHQAVLITHRVDSLPMLFIVLSLIWFIQAIQLKHKWQHLIALLFCTLALFSKESAVVYPGLILLVVIFFWSDWKLNWLEAAKLLLPYTLVDLVFVVFRLVLMPRWHILSNSPLITLFPPRALFNIGVRGVDAAFFQIETTLHFAIYGIGLSLAMLTVFGFLWQHFSLIRRRSFWLINLGLVATGFLIGYVFQSMNIYYVALALTIYFQIALFLKGIRRNWHCLEFRLIGLGLAWVLVSIIVYLTKPARDRLMFIPSIGTCLIVSVAAYIAWRDWRGGYVRRIVPVGLAMLIILLEFTVLSQVWGQYYAPSSPYSHYANLAWYPAARQDTIWGDRKIDEATLQLYEAQLVADGLIDASNLGLNVNETYLAKSAYWIREPDPLYRLLFGAPMPQSPGYLVSHFIDYGLPINVSQK